MHRISFYLLITIFTVVNCQTKKADYKTSEFEKGLDSLQSYFEIPGMAVLVKEGEKIIFEDYKGYADIENKTAVDSSTIFPIASVTKVFAGVALLKLQEEGKLSLDDPINKYIPESNLPEIVKVKHILSHTSQGVVPGEHFLYSYRYGMLTAVIAQASGLSFEEHIREVFFEGIPLYNTYLNTNEEETQKWKETTARPYVFNGNTEAGTYDYGVSASSGIASSVRDIAAFDNALNEGVLLSEKAKEKMFSGFRNSEGEELTYGLGIFVQDFQGMRLVWGYGQEDHFSSLFVKIPEKDLTLVILANNNLMSDSARLISGDLSYSLFALNFLEHFTEVSDSVIEKEKHLARALAAGFFGQRNNQVEMDKSAELFQQALEIYPEIVEEEGLSLLHGLAVADVLGGRDSFEDEIFLIGKRILDKDPFNPYVNFYLGLYNDVKKSPREAYPYFNKILQADNYSRFWYTVEAENFMKNYKE